MCIRDRIWTPPTSRSTAGPDAGVVPADTLLGPAGCTWRAGHRPNGRWRWTWWPATTTSGHRPPSCCAGPSRCSLRRSADGPGSGLMPATSTPRWRTVRSSWAVTSRSRRSETLPPGGPFRPSRRPPGKTPAGWKARRSRPVTTPPLAGPTGTCTIVRRVKVPVEQLSADPRSRRRRTVPKDQLALALGGAADHVWAVSFIVTNIPANHADLIGLEAWFRNRTSIEERFREGKHGAGLNHLPSADADVNSVWAWAGLLAGALSVMLQSLTGLDTQLHAPGRMRIATLRHQLLNIPGRLTSHAREHVLRLQPRQQLLAGVLARLRALPAPT